MILICVVAAIWCVLALGRWFRVLLCLLAERWTGRWQPELQFEISGTHSSGSDAVMRTARAVVGPEPDVVSGDTSQDCL